MTNLDESYISAFIDGTATLDEIDSWVESWHRNPHGKTLDEYLGFTESEGVLWAKDPHMLPYIVTAHAYGVPVEEIIANPSFFLLGLQ